MHIEPEKDPFMTLSSMDYQFEFVREIKRAIEKDDIERLEFLLGATVWGEAPIVDMLPFDDFIVASVIWSFLIPYKIKMNSFLFPRGDVYNVGHYAVKLRAIKCFKFLSPFLDLTVIDGYGKSYQQQIEQGNGNSKLMEQLIVAHKDAGLEFDIDGCLIYSINHFRLNMVKSLLKHGADPTIRKYLPVRMCLSSQKWKKLDVLLSHEKVDVCAPELEFHIGGYDGLQRHKRCHLFVSILVKHGILNHTSARIRSQLDWAESFHGEKFKLPPPPPVHRKDLIL